MAADMCEINNNLSHVKEIIEHIFKSKEDEQKAEWREIERINLMETNKLR